MTQHVCKVRKIRDETAFLKGHHCGFKRGVNVIEEDVFKAGLRVVLQPILQVAWVRAGHLGVAVQRLRTRRHLPGQHVPLAQPKEGVGNPTSAPQPGWLLRADALPDSEADSDFKSVWTAIQIAALHCVCKEVAAKHQLVSCSQRSMNARFRAGQAARDSLQILVDVKRRAQVVVLDILDVSSSVESQRGIVFCRLPGPQ
mmetsp:Transcript_118552/g.330756  ORF Transcript_118552/g.330756 Transcript_118552/m.330756 type:complete len:200 (-) Transcript_118552:311-910(-)